MTSMPISLPQFNVHVPDGCVIGLIGPRGVETHVSPARALAVTDLDAFEKSKVAVTLATRRRSGETIFVYSNDERFLLAVSDEIWWLDLDGLRKKGDPREVVDLYLRDAASRFRAEFGGQIPQLSPTFRRGDGRAEIDSIETPGMWASGEPVSIRVRVRYAANVEDPVLGIMIRSRIGMEVYGTNTELEAVRLGPVKAGEARTVRFEFVCSLCPNDYTITVASHDPLGIWHDWLDDAIGVTVTDSRYTAGVANLRARVTVEPVH